MSRECLSCVSGPVPVHALPLAQTTGTDSSLMMSDLHCACECDLNHLATNHSREVPDTELYERAHHYYTQPYVEVTSYRMVNFRL